MLTIGSSVRYGRAVVDAQVPVEGLEDPLQGDPRAWGAAQEVALDSKPCGGCAGVDVCLGNVPLDLLQSVPQHVVSC